MIFTQHNIEVFDDLRTFADCALLMDLSFARTYNDRDSSGNVSTSGPTVPVGRQRLTRNPVVLTAV